MSWNNISEIIMSHGTIVINIVAAIVILFVGWVIASFFRRKIRRSTVSKRTINDTLRPVLASLAYYFIILTALYAALRQIGVEPTTLLAAFGAAGLAIALALKETLANIAAGVMLLFVRSLQVGDYVELPGSSGTIEEIGLFSTNLRDSQGIAVYVPNNIIWSNRVQNYNRHGARKAIINIVVSYKTDLKQAQNILTSVLESISDVKSIPTGPEVYITDFLDRGANISCRLWLPGDNWTARTSDVRINLKQALDKANIDIATYQLSPVKA